MWGDFTLVTSASYFKEYKGIRVVFVGVLFYNPGVPNQFDRV
jgi:hypothetical protein